MFSRSAEIVVIPHKDHAGCFGREDIPPFNNQLPDLHCLGTEYLCTNKRGLYKGDFVTF